jgi:hypothetical protein
MMSLVNYFHISPDDFISRDLATQGSSKGKKDAIVIEEPTHEYIMKTDRRVDI